MTAVWESLADLASATDESEEGLRWLADRSSFADHYRTRWVPKGGPRASEGGGWRQTETKSYRRLRARSLEGFSDAAQISS
ncbi:MAG: hypothetical protein AAGA56_13130 [Myxococcota bacterium]